MIKRAVREDKSMRVAVLQVNSRDNKTENIDRALDMLDRAADAGVDLAVLPECVDFLGPAERAVQVSEPIPGAISRAFAERARRHGMWVLGGSMREQSEDPGHAYNTSVLYNRSGAIAAKYRKIHMYDVDMPGHVSVQESATVTPGNEFVTADIEGHTAGLTTCYDLRFPELYRALAVRGAEILFVPAAFTMYTGKDHWEILLRARAIENQCFVIAADQSGRHEPNMTCYGRSMIIDPWGTVLATAPDGVNMAIADLDFAQLRRIRAELPSLANRRPDVYGANERAVSHARNGTNASAVARAERS
jgi:predicted amidohydrolase